MSAKLVVHKIDENINLKSLYITFENEDNATSARYGEWLEGRSLHKKRDMQKSRLVVKIVSGNEHSDFNLDSCAKSIDPLDAFYSTANQRNLITLNKENFTNKVTERDPNSYNRSEKDLYNYINYKNYDERIRGNNPITIKSSANSQDTTVHKPLSILPTNLSPLEYSLEKVKENNARIMENIHMLNRTLNYTKNKEILDTISCVKNLRYPCNTCGKCFVYKTGLKRHYSMRHAMSEMQPRWQVVWTCIECFQVWPRKDLALDHSSQCCKPDTADCVREIKTSSLLQCEFCEKVFTSIPRLLRHSKIHTTVSNYECNACDSSFASYKAAEQHWLLCPWLKMCYSFALPKMLLCNACDRKFRSYEQLYNHRYKVGHFMTKTHSHKGNVKSLGILVYQCEMCSQWLQSIQTLQTHRNQHHSGFDNYDTELQHHFASNQN